MSRGVHRVVEEDRQRLAEALRALVDKLDVIAQHQEYLAVWALADAHGLVYDGPTWERELVEARRVLG